IRRCLARRRDHHADPDLAIRMVALVVRPHRHCGIERCGQPLGPGRDCLPGAPAQQARRSRRGVVSVNQARHAHGRRDGWTWAGIAVVATAAAVMSFDALRRLAERAGVGASLSWLLPIAVDAAIIVATRTWLAGPAGCRVTRYARAVALASLA